MIENFAPQPYPLECSPNGETWFLVIGWQRLGDGRLAPVLATKDSGLAVSNDTSTLHYRLTGSRIVQGALEPMRSAEPDKRRGSDRPPSSA